MGTTDDQVLALLADWREYLIDGFEVEPVINRGRLVGLQLRLAAECVDQTDEHAELH